MKTIIIKKVKTERQKIISITCNKCGIIIQPKNETDYSWPDKIQSFKIYWGYGSGHDEEIWEFDLCENCLEQLAKSFKIPLENSLYS